MRQGPSSYWLIGERNRAPAEPNKSTARTGDLAAGMCFDAGTHREAQRCFRLAVACATDAGDWSMRSKALSGLSNLAVHQGRTEDALSFSTISASSSRCARMAIASTLATRA